MPCFFYKFCACKISFKGAGENLQFITFNMSTFGGLPKTSKSPKKPDNEIKFPETFLALKCLYKYN